ncbi:MAG: NfeD family protein [Chloroflexota bacterium]
MWCHVLLFSPVWGLGLFLILPWPVALLLYLVIVAVSLFLYVKIMQTMREPVLTGREALLGRMAEVGLAGTLKLAGERWQIDDSAGLVPGQQVRIVGMTGMRLKVQPVDEGG